MLSSNSIYLSAIKTDEELLEMYHWINTKDLVNFNSYFLPIHFKNHLEWFDYVRKDRSVILFGIKRSSDSKLVGTCQLNSINLIYRKAQLQIRLSLDNVAKGYGRDALSLLIDYGFNELNLNKIYLNVFSTNHRALLLYKKIGFIQEGSLREDVFLNGKYIDVYVMSILKSEWR